MAEWWHTDRGARVNPAHVTHVEAAPTGREEAPTGWNVWAHLVTGERLHVARFADRMFADALVNELAGRFDTAGASLAEAQAAVEAVDSYRPGRAS